MVSGLGKRLVLVSGFRALDMPVLVVTVVTECCYDY
jgi:hypothetical protein